MTVSATAHGLEDRAQKSGGLHPPKPPIAQLADLADVASVPLPPSVRAWNDHRADDDAVLSRLILDRSDPTPTPELTVEETNERKATTEALDRRHRNRAEGDSLISHRLAERRILKHCEPLIDIANACQVPTCGGSTHKRTRANGRASGKTRGGRCRTYACEYCGPRLALRHLSGVPFVDLCKKNLVLRDLQASGTGLAGKLADLPVGASLWIVSGSNTDDLVKFNGRQQKDGNRKNDARARVTLKTVSRQWVGISTAPDRDGIEATAVDAMSHVVAGYLDLIEAADADPVGQTQTRKHRIDMGGSWQRVSEPVNDDVRISAMGVESSDSESPDNSPDLVEESLFSTTLNTYEIAVPIVEKWGGMIYKRKNGWDFDDMDENGLPELDKACGFLTTAQISALARDRNSRHRWEDAEVAA
jgi:hypothetical protein